MTGSTSACSKRQDKKEQQRLHDTRQDTALGNSFLSCPTLSAARSLNLSQNILPCSSHHHLSSLTLAHKASPRPKQTKFQPKVCVLCFEPYFNCSPTVQLKGGFETFVAAAVNLYSQQLQWILMAAQSQKTRVKSYLHVHRTSQSTPTA